MPNEITLLTDFRVRYEPSIIKIENESQLAEFVAKMVEHYDSLVFTDDNINEAKESRKELNRLFGAIDEQRKEVKQGYSKPLVQFESTIKKYSNDVKRISDKIKIQLDDYDDKMRIERQKLIAETILDVIGDSGVDPQKVEIKSTWLNKGAFNSGGTVAKKTVKEIESAVNVEIKELQRIENDSAVVTNLAVAFGLEPDGWTSFVRDGQTAAELMPRLQQAGDDKKARIAEEERQAEAKTAEEERLAQANIEYEEAMRQLELKKQQQVGDVVVDTETGEVVDDVEEPLVPFESTSGQITVALQLTGTINQMQALNQYLVANDIKVIEV